MKTILDDKKIESVLILFVVIILAILLSGAASAATIIYVNGTSGNDTWNGESPVWNGVSGPKKTIQSGANTVSVNGTVYIAEGIYYEHVNIPRSLNLTGNGISSTFIDGNSTGRVITINNSFMVTISLLTLRNGKSPDGANGADGNPGEPGHPGSNGGDGGAIYNQGTLTLTNCNIMNSHAGNGGNGGTGADYGWIGGNGGNGGYGGAIYNNGTLNVTSCYFTGNYAGNGGNGGSGTANNYDGGAPGGAGGSGGAGGAIYNNGTLYVSNSNTSGNYAGNGGTGGPGGSTTYQKAHGGVGGLGGAGGNGGAIYNNGYSSYIVYTSTGNYAGNGGTGGIGGNAGGRYLYEGGIGGDGGSGGAGGNGGAIFNAQTASWTNYTINSNYAGNGGSGGQGGTIITMYSTCGNGGNGGPGGSGGAIYNNQTMDLNNATLSYLTNNRAGNGGAGGNAYTAYGYADTVGGDGGDAGAGGNGGAIFNTGTLTVSNCNLINNYSGSGGSGGNGSNGGAGGTAGDGGNGGPGGSGGANYNTGTLTVSNCNIINNYSGSGGAAGAAGPTPVGTGNPGSPGSPGSGGALYTNGGTVTIRFNRIYGNTANTITRTGGTVDAQYNWWGSNNSPLSQFTGTVNYSPWLYMTLTPTPSFVLNGGTSTLTVSFNNAYDGGSLTTFNPAGGHLPDGCVITITTDLGNVGSKITTKTTTNGIATATLTANEGIGTAHISAQFDNQTVNSTVGIEVLYVNGVTGNDAWDGTSPIYLSGASGPKRTIQNAINTVNAGGTIKVANATYNEHLSVTKNLNINGTSIDSTIIDGTGNGRVINITAVSSVNITNLTIRNGSITGDGGGIYSLGGLNINNCIISGNTATASGGGIYAAGSTNINNSVITGNTAISGGGIAYGWNTITIRYSRLTGNSASNGREIYRISTSTIDAMYNWWGQNSGPVVGQISGAVITSPWLYMNFTANPTFLLNGGTSTLTVNLNNIYDGSTVTPINPASGHLVDGCVVIFTTDLGNVGSKIAYKSTSNGIAIATLTADEGIGFAHVSGSLDNQNSTSTIRIHDTNRYVNSVTGNDSWDGTSSTFLSGTTGPMKTIQSAINAVETGGTVNVAAGTYNEHLSITKNLNLTGASRDTTIINGTNSGRVINIAAVSSVNITNFTIRNGTVTGDGAGIYSLAGLNVNNCIILANTATSRGGGIYAAGSTTVINCIIIGNSAVNGGGISYGWNTITIRYSRLTGNSALAGREIYEASSATIDAMYNWWGQNSGPVAGQISGTATYSPWLYMTLTADPNLIFDGWTSTLTASFNNLYDGGTVTPINPAGGHLPDGSVVTFTTDLGNVGSKITTKTTANGVAIATLTADEGPGNAFITAQQDSQTVNTTVVIANTLYVNVATGKDDWNGLSPTYLGGDTGPMQTIQHAIDIIHSDGTIHVASGTYIETLIIGLNLNLLGSGAGSCIISAPNSFDNIITITEKTIVLISGFTIEGATNGNGVIIGGKDTKLENNTITHNKNGILIPEELKAQIFSNYIVENDAGIRTLSNRIEVHYNRFTNNNIHIYTEIDGIDAANNWWGSNNAPEEIWGVVNSPWLYMTLTANPATILETRTSQIIASFNNAYDGYTLNPLDPALGHLVDGCVVTFTTDLGNVGSKIITKNTANGVAIATLTADEGIGTAHLTAELDSQIVYTNVVVTDTLYVNAATGNNGWDGTSSTYIGGTTGPMRTIQHAIDNIYSGGIIRVASGTYGEVLNVDLNLNLIGSGASNCLIAAHDPHDTVITFTEKVKEALLTGFTIQGATSGTGIIIWGGIVTIENDTITNNLCGIHIAEEIRAYITSNNIYGNDIGIRTSSDRINVNFNRISANDVPIDTEVEGIDATYNWWGNNVVPELWGVVNNPWLYMTLNANPTTIYNGGNSLINASFNNAYDGYTITPFNPASGHLVDGCVVTFTTDLGNVGSKITTKNTTNGVSTAILTANETYGTAYITGELDDQLLNLNIIIEPVRYVNVVTGNDTWDGSSPIWINGLIGPMKTIQTALNAVEVTGTVLVASGTYTENILIDKSIILKAGEEGVIIQPAIISNAVLAINSGGSGSIISGLILTGSSNSEIYIDSANGVTITNNTVNGTAGIEKSLWGICLVYSSGNNITNNTVTNCEEGINFYSVQHTIISKNTVKNNHWDNIALNLSLFNNIAHNTISNADSGIRLIGGSNYNNVTANNLTANVWTSISLVSSYYNQIKEGNILSNNQAGTYLYDSHNNTLSGNVVQNNIWDGIALHNSSYNTITNHYLISGNNDGIFIVGTSNHNTIISNNVVGNIWAGIALNTATVNTITRNNITGAHVGIYLSGSSQNVISLNNVTSNDWDGIDVLYSSNQNTIMLNNISGSYYGERILDSTANTSYMNNFVSNTVQTYDNSTPSATNYWDNGVTGNYYSDWPSISPRPVDGGVSVDRYPSLTHF